jgi:hypothetical protein
MYFYLERTNGSILNNNILPDVYPPRIISSPINQPDLSRAFRVDAHLLAIIRLEDKRSKFEKILIKLKFYIYL